MPDLQEKIQSPEQLNNYIHVTRSGAWIVLTSILVFLVGFFVWGFYGELEISFPAFIYTQGEKSSAFIMPDKAIKLRGGGVNSVRLSNGGAAGVVSEVSAEALNYESISELVGGTNALAMNINQNDKLVKVDVNIKGAPQGVSRAIIVTDKVKPLSFLLK